MLIFLDGIDGSRGHRHGGFRRNLGPVRRVPVEREQFGDSPFRLG
jgi:hypothetical protein